AIPQTEAQRYASIPTHPETQQHLFEIVPPVFTMPVGWPRCLWGLWFIFIRSMECNGRRVLMQPWCGNGIDLQGCERNGAIHRVEIGRRHRLEYVAQAVIIHLRAGQ